MAQKTQMKLTAAEIAKMVGGKLQGDERVTVTGAATLKDASVNDISFLNSAKYFKDLSISQAGIVLIKNGFNAGKQAAIFVENPQSSFSKILSLLQEEKREKPEGIHPTAVISKGADIGSKVSIGAYSVIEREAVIGEGTEIGAQCYIGKKSTLGKNCKIYPQVVIREEVLIHEDVIVHSGSVIGSDGFGYIFEDQSHKKIPQIGKIEIESQVEIGACVTIDRATTGRTRIGRGSKIDNLVQIAHNVQIGEGCIIVSQAGIAGSSKIGNFVTLAGQVGVVGHISIGDRVIAAAQSGIPNDVPAGSIIFGSPARPLQEERKIQAIIGKLPKIYDDFKKIKKILKIGAEKESHGAETKNHP